MARIDFTMEKSVDVHIAALYRQNFVVETVKSVLANPEVKTITVIANKHTDEEFENCKNGLLQANTLTQIPIFLHRGDNAKESNEKLRYIGKGDGKYISFVDNDLLLAPTHFEYLIQGCEKYNAYVSLHGVILDEIPLGSYYRDRQVFRGLKTVDFDVQVDISSNCGSLFKRGFFGNEYLRELYDYAPTVSMDDIIMGTCCKLNQIRCWVLKHQEGFLRHKVQYAEDDYVFNKYALTGNDSVQTAYINKYWDVFKKL